MSSIDQTGPHEDHETALLADELAERVRRGEHVDFDELAKKSPELAQVAVSLVKTLKLISGIPSSKLLFDQGASFGKYKIVRELGRGGMGIVYQAYDNELNRDVALKVLPNPLRNERLNTRLLYEARAAAQLDHPNIVDVYEVGCFEEIRFLAMRMITGLSLAQIINWTSNCCNISSNNFSTRANAPLESAEIHLPDYGTGKWWQWAANLALQAAKGLHHAHGAGVIHRDIKPSNLMVDRNHCLWITDFGIARFESGVPLTESMDLIGTPQYMSPEQAGFEDRPLDLRSDVYSLGITLYELLTLAPAIELQSRARMLKRLTSYAVHIPKNANPNIPLPLSHIVTKATSFDPQHRYNTCDEFAEDLNRFLAGAPVHASRPGLVHRIIYFSKRYRLSLLIICICLAIIAGILSIAVWQVDRARRSAILDKQAALSSESNLRKLTREANDRRQEAEQLRVSTDRALWRALVAEARLRLDDRSVGHRQQTLSALTTAQAVGERLQIDDSGLQDLTNLTIDARCSEDLLYKKSVPLAKHSHQIESTAFSPNYQYYSKHIFYQLLICKTDDDQVVARIDLVDFPLHTLFSPDSELVAIVGEEPNTERQTLRLFDWKTGVQILHLGTSELGSDLQRMAIAFHPSGDQLALGLAAGELLIVDLSKLYSDKVSSEHALDPIDRRIILTGAPHGIVYSPDGHQVAISCPDSQLVQIYDLRSDESSVEISPSEAPYAIAWRSDGAELAIGSGFSVELWRKSPDDSWVRDRLLGHQEAPVHELYYHPYGNHLVSHGYDGRSRIWNRCCERSILELEGHACAFSSDGNLLAVRGADDVKIYTPFFENFYCILPSLYGSSINDIELLQNGRAIAIAHEHGVEIWDTDRRQLRQFLDIENVTDMKTGCLTQDVLGMDQTIDPSSATAEMLWLATDNGIAEYFANNRLAEPPFAEQAFQLRKTLVEGEAVELFDLTYTDYCEVVFTTRSQHTLYTYQEKTKRKALVPNVLPATNIALSQDASLIGMSELNRASFRLVSARDFRDILTIESKRGGKISFLETGPDITLFTCSPHEYAIWSYPQGTLLARVAYSAGVERPCVAHSVEKNLLLIKSSASQIQLARLSDLSSIAKVTVPGDSKPAIGATISANGDAFAVAFDDYVVVWALSSLLD